MEELNAKLNAEFFEELEKEGRVLIKFSQEEREEWRKKYNEFNEKESKIERLVREERVKAAAKPDIYFTF